MESGAIRVLLVDDDEDDYLITRDLLCEVQDRGRFDLEWVATYDDALQVMERGEHDVYLLDYRLGERDGLQLLREALAKGCKAPMILVTGQGDREVDLEAMKAGAADYLVKAQIDALLLERSIRYAIERKRIERLKDDLIAFVSHELRTPLAAIKGYAETLRLQDVAERGALADELLDGMSHAAEQLARRADAFLDISRIDAGQPLELVQTRFDVRGLVEEAVEVQRAAALPCALARCAFEVQSGDDVGTIRADREKLLQVLVNLLSNADKYSPDGGTVRVKVSAGEDEVRFAVIDQGIGIAEDAVHDLFTPFYRVRDLKRRKIRGTGVGLHLCKHLVEVHGGRIWVESEPGKGTACYFTIPK